MKTTAKLATLVVIGGLVGASIYASDWTDWYDCDQSANSIGEGTAMMTDTCSYDEAYAKALERAKNSADSDLQFHADYAATHNGDCDCDSGTPSGAKLVGKTVYTVVKSTYGASTWWVRVQATLKYCCQCHYED